MNMCTCDKDEILGVQGKAQILLSVEQSLLPYLFHVFTRLNYVNMGRLTVLSTPEFGPYCMSGGIIMIKYAWLHFPFSQNFPLELNWELTISFLTSVHTNINLCLKVLSRYVNRWLLLPRRRPQIILQQIASNKLALVHIYSKGLFCFIMIFWH